MTGAGVGLTMPTFMSTGAGALPPQAFSTGSAVLNMLRQVGLAVGVSVFVAVVGSPRDTAGVARRLAARLAHGDRGGAHRRGWPETGERPTP